MSSRLVKASAAAAFLAMSVSACDSAASRDNSASETGPGGTIVIATGGDADVLIPPLSATIQGRQIAELVFDHLADIGDSLNTRGDAGFRPRLAQSWRWSPDSLSIAFTLNPDARWHDGRAVRAGDVAFTHRLYAAPETASPVAPLIASIDSVTAADSVTAVFWFARRSPMQFFDAVYQMVILPEHLLRGATGTALRSSAFARQPVGSGRFRFARWRAGSSIELRADSANYRGRPTVNRVIWSVAPDFNTALTRLIGGEADVLESLAANHLEQVAARPNLRTHARPGLEYNFIQFNFRVRRDSARAHPLFADRSMRRALAMAVHRERIVRNVYDTLARVALGPTVRAFPTTDPALPQLRHSPQEAAALLDSLGWKDANGDGVRERGGTPLEFTLLVPSSSRTRVNMAVLVQEQLRTAGVRMHIEQMEFATFVDRQRRGDFDAAFGSWNTDPGGGGLRQTWGSAGAQGRGGSNYGRYHSRVFDAHVDSALSSMSVADARRHFSAAYRRITADAAAIWMAEPRAVLGAHRRIRVPPLRADAWWASLADWEIPANERIARDRVTPAG